MQTNPAVEQNTNVKCQEVHGISLVGEEMVYGVGEKKVLNTDRKMLKVFIH